MTAEQTDNLAKHFYAGALRESYGREFSDAQEVYLWNGGPESERERFRRYARVIAAMFPDGLAPYLDTAPF